MSLGWLSIGAEGEISLTNLNVDNGTLFVDKESNQVGIGTTQPRGIVQIGSPDDPINSSVAPNDAALNIFNETFVTPNVEGNPGLGGNVLVHTTAQYTQNRGAGIAMGGLSPFPNNDHVMYTRLSGVATTEGTPQEPLQGGDFVVETMDTDRKLYERMRIRRNGNVGIGSSNPSVKLDVNGVLKVGQKTLVDQESVEPSGIINNGYRIEAPSGTAYNSNSSIIEDRIRITTAQSIITPPMGTDGWISRIDAEDGDEVVNCLVAFEPTDTVFSTGSFTNRVKIYGDDNVLNDAFNFEGRLYPENSGAFVSKINTTAKYTEEFAIIEYSAGDVVATSVCMRETTNPSAPDVIIVGYITTNPDSLTTTLRIYDSARVDITSTSGRLMELGFPSGSTVGFIARYSYSLLFRNIVFIGGTGTGYEIIPTNCRVRTSTDQLYVAGHFKVSGDITFLGTNFKPNAVETPTTDLTASFTNTEYDIFMGRYNLNSSGDITPNVFNFVTDTGDEKIDFPSQSLEIDQGTGDVYLCGYFKSPTVFFKYQTSVIPPQIQLTTGPSLTLEEAFSGFIVKYIPSSGILQPQWTTKITTATPGRGVNIRSILLTEERLVIGDPLVKRLYLVGTTYGTNTRFYSAGTYTPNPVTMQTTSSTFGNSFLAKYTAGAGDYLWSTMNSARTGEVVGMFVKNDSGNNIYTVFEYVNETVGIPITVNVYQRSGRVANSNLFTPSTTNHLIRGVSNFVGVVCYNQEGKVLFTSKIDGSRQERATALEILPQTSNMILGMTTSGERFNCYDMGGLSFKFVSGLTDNTVSGRRAAFIVGYPSFTFYLLDAALEPGTMKRITNTTLQRAYIIPFYEDPVNIENTFSKNIFTVPEYSSIELGFAGGAGTNGTWYPVRDPDAGLIYIDKVNGGVGIGTTVPSELFHIEGTTLVRGNLIVDGLIINPFTSFGSDGRIGIGTTDPAAFIHINKPNPSIILQTTLTTNENPRTAGAIDFLTPTKKGFRITYDARQGTGVNEPNTDSLYIKLLKSGAEVPLEMEPPALTITNRLSTGSQFIGATQGRVGIGTTEPSAKLHVEGSMNVNTGRFSITSPAATPSEFNSSINSWTTTIGANFRGLSDVVWANELERGVAISFESIVGTNPGTIYISRDLTDWSSKAVPLGGLRSITWSSDYETFAAVSDSGQVGQRVLTSVGDIDTWTRKSTPSGLRNWNSVAWSSILNRAVAVGDGNVMYAFVDTTGANNIMGDWILVNPPLRKDWRSVIWVQELNRFIAVGGSGSGSAMYSSDGINWTLATTPSDTRYTWNSVAYSPVLNRLVAVGESDWNALNRIMTSDNGGQTWTARTSLSETFTVGPFTDLMRYTSVVWGLGRFVVCAWTIDSAISIIVRKRLNSFIYSSADGITWTRSATSPDSTWSSLVVGPSEIIAISGNQHNDSVYGYLTRVLRITSFFPSYSSASYTVTANNWTSITRGRFNPLSINEIYVAVASTGTNRIMTSPDGITWTTYTSNAITSGTWRSITSLSGRTFFITISGETLSSIRSAISSNGSTWTLKDTPSDYGWTSITYAPRLGTFAAVASSGNPNQRVMTSSDGETWSIRTSPSRAYEAIVWSEELELFAAVSTDGFGSQIMTSPDGINWTLRTTPILTPETQFINIAWSPTLRLFVSLPTVGSSNALISNDGINWSSTPVPDFGWRKVIWSPGLGAFIGVKLSGSTLVTSRDGTNWTTYTNPVGAWSSIAWAPKLGRLVAVSRTNVNKIAINNRFIPVVSDIEGSSNINGELLIYNQIATPIGVGQEWLNVSSSRTASTIYTNNTGRPIMVAIGNNNWSNSDADSRRAEVSKDGSSWISVGTITGKNIHSSCSFIVPAGWRYRVLGDFTKAYWSELR
jgi:hypothetical protein